MFSTRLSIWVPGANFDGWYCCLSFFVDLFAGFYVCLISFCAFVPGEIFSWILQIFEYFQCSLIAYCYCF